MEKLIKDGKVAVLYHPAFGSGWYSWNNNQQALFDPEIAQAILDKNRELAKEIANIKYPDLYDGAIDKLEVKFLPQGTIFEISEFDGKERIEICYEYYNVA